MYSPGVFKLTIQSIVSRDATTYITADNGHSVTTIAIHKLGSQRSLFNKLQELQLLPNSEMYFTFNDVYGVYNGKTYKKLKCVDITTEDGTLTELYSFEENASNAHKLIYDKLHNLPIATFTTLDKIYIYLKSKLS
jgi:hypothetical protein